MEKTLLSRAQSGVEAFDATPYYKPVSVGEAEAAIAVLLRYIGEDPTREGLVETPARFIRACGHHFAGYAQDPLRILATTFSESAGYAGMILLRDIRFEAFCEHHLAPIIGKAHVAYMPNDRVVGLSKLARVVDVFAKRLQLQERMTMQIATAIEAALAPRGVAVLIESEHHCMSTRGAYKPGSTMVTSVTTGCFEADGAPRREFFEAVRA
ncbi:GTP cyclohydrolase I FolE [Rhodospirillum rubrum]|uniref:GTP cyclohydrolase 1 n=1 Tax=Rhodospirillum rubrum (strain ATCC 11170 / ATH 1.1.1 / DSM 467 / LMG 4362 / NCIMB 8255 / S1) TaxID=269796 RepID=Q2RTB3_RHORT|nr:GTP cyclohydrolase I FolE [Rhodospirillum rubrum]ABC22632.1 GTP cyclohydrolase [Rhodospirillum rubrum ATCC 11170]AEO48350.1 GTP cyclohydrolase [Rhodospirillum rubrum F11]MBK5954229.1 GTP cyclohydrolase I FolE [Rhodospirillum rubrum]QXG82254.1 GTP cyclohydrolase I FolE [Rhodospirillum rubrum]HAP99188.1 GTP cyclohydrolase I FolE [Rhodospirillum rubrum]